MRLSPTQITRSDGRRPAGEGFRLLIVEDDAVNRQLALLQLAKLGYEADTAADGLEALEALSRIPYGLVLMDCRLPGMDGFAVTAELRRREGRRHTPVIAMTADDQESDRENCLAAGMDDYVSKPLKASGLARALAPWVEPVGASELAAIRELLSEEPQGAFERFVRVYTESARKSVDELRDGLASADARKTEIAAHTLKGASGSLGARRLVGLCQQIEEAARLGNLAGLAPVAGAVEDEFDRVRAALSGRTIAQEAQ